MVKAYYIIILIVSIQSISAMDSEKKKLYKITKQKKMKPTIFISPKMFKNININPQQKIGTSYQNTQPSPPKQVPVTVISSTDKSKTNIKIKSELNKVERQNQQETLEKSEMCTKIVRSKINVEEGLCNLCRPNKPYSNLSHHLTTSAHINALSNAVNKEIKKLENTRKVQNYEHLPLPLREYVTNNKQLTPQQLTLIREISFDLLFPKKAKFDNLDAIFNTETLDILKEISKNVDQKKGLCKLCKIEAFDVFGKNYSSTEEFEKHLQSDRHFQTVVNRVNEKIEEKIENNTHIK
jgi:hypothetical protein